MPVPTRADAEDVPVGMAQMHLADVPRHVGRRPGNVQSGIDAAAMNGVHAVDEDRHPHALVGLPVLPRVEGGSVCALAATALRALKEEDFESVGTDSAEARWIAPVPELALSPFLEPGNGSGEIGDVEDRVDVLHFHGAEG